MDQPGSGLVAGAGQVRRPGRVDREGVGLVLLGLVDRRPGRAIMMMSRSVHGLGAGGRVRGMSSSALVTVLISAPATARSDSRSEPSMPAEPVIRMRTRLACHRGHLPHGHRGCVGAHASPPPRRAGGVPGVVRRVGVEQAVGHPLDLRQANLSVSATGVVRGVHFAQLPPSQAKYVTCPSGAVLDVVVDVRTGSPTYGQWDSSCSTTSTGARSTCPGLGHAFVALAEGSVVSYLCSAPYAPGREHGINPDDAGLAIDPPDTGRDGRPLEHRLSDKDAAAPTLAEVAAAGLLPAYDDVLAFRRRASVPA